MKQIKIENCYQCPFTVAFGKKSEPSFICIKLTSHNEEIPIAKNGVRPDCPLEDFKEVSDEEIRKQAINRAESEWQEFIGKDEERTYAAGFADGCEWYREQIKNKNHDSKILLPGTK